MERETLFSWVWGEEIILLVGVCGDWVSLCIIVLVGVESRDNSYGRCVCVCVCVDHSLGACGE